MDSNIRIDGNIRISGNIRIGGNIRIDGNTMKVNRIGTKKRECYLVFLTDVHILVFSDFILQCKCSLSYFPTFPVWINRECFFFPFYFLFSFILSPCCYTAIHFHTLNKVRCPTAASPHLVNVVLSKIYCQKYYQKVFYRISRLSFFLTKKERCRQSRKQFSRMSLINNLVTTKMFMTLSFFPIRHTTIGKPPNQAEQTKKADKQAFMKQAFINSNIQSDRHTLIPWHGVEKRGKI